MKIDYQQLIGRTPLEALEHHESLSSTNDRAREVDLQQTQAPLLITADRQTAGRGRGANRWWMGKGGLAMTLLLKPEVRYSPAHLSLATGVALVESVATYLPDQNVGIHWPNDVYLFPTPRKLGGILVEVTAENRVIIGIGLNTNNTAEDAPEPIREKLATMRDIKGESINTTALLVALLSKLLPALANEKDLADLAHRADTYCFERGQFVKYISAGHVIEGEVVKIDQDGALVLKTRDGLERLMSGVSVS